MFTVFHISDPHFGAMDNEWPIKTINKFSDGLNGHNEDIWRAFSTHIKDRISKCPNDYVVCITGDLSQIGSINNFRLAKRLLFKSTTKTDIDNDSLQLVSDNLLIVPGNHDAYDGKIFQENNLRSFRGLIQPQIDGYPFIVEKKLSGNNVVFIGFDSTYTKNVYTPSRKMGKGIIEDSQYDKASGALQLCKNKIKIACLHHCPIFPNCKRDMSLALENAAKFIDWASRNEIDIILCGHIHDDFYDILPLKRLIRHLPKRRGLPALLKRMYYRKVCRQSVLSEYTPVRIKGQYAKYFDSIAYRYILDHYKETFLEKNFKDLKEFEEYLVPTPEYKDFLEQFDDFKNKKTALIMSGSLCQDSVENKNSYIELNIDPLSGQIALLRHCYNCRADIIETKMRYLNFRNNKPMRSVSRRRQN